MNISNPNYREAAVRADRVEFATRKKLRVEKLFGESNPHYNDMRFLALELFHGAGCKDIDDCSKVMAIQLGISLQAQAWAKFEEDRVHEYVEEQSSPNERKRMYNITNRCYESEAEDEWDGTWHENNGYKSVKRAQRVDTELTNTFKEVKNDFMLAYLPLLGDLEDSECFAAYEPLVPTSNATAEDEPALLSHLDDMKNGFLNFAEEVAAEKRRLIAEHPYPLRFIDEDDSVDESEADVVHGVICKGKKIPIATGKWVESHQELLAACEPEPSLHAVNSHRDFLAAFQEDGLPSVEATNAMVSKLPRDANGVPTVLWRGQSVPFATGEPRTSLSDSDDEPTPPVVYEVSRDLNDEIAEAKEDDVMLL